MGEVNSNQSSVISNTCQGPAIIGAALVANRRKPMAESVMGYDLDLDAGALRQGGDLDGGTRREVRGEVFGIDLVHPGKVGQVRQEHRALDDIGEGQLLVVKDGLDVLQGALSLRLDVAGDEVPGGRINGDLAGAEKQATDAHGMVVRPYCGSRFGRFDDNLLRHRSAILLNPDTCARSAPAPESSWPASIYDRS